MSSGPIGSDKSSFTASKNAVLLNEAASYIE